MPHVADGVCRIVTGFRRADAAELDWRQAVRD
jgi:hypothetical protein